MTSKIIDTNIVDAIVRINTDDIDAAYDSITSIMDRMHATVDDIDAAIYHVHNRTPCITTIWMAMLWIRLQRAVLPRIAELAYQDRPRDEIAKDITDLLDKYTSDIINVTDPVIDTLMLCESCIIPHVLPYLLSRYAPPSDINDTLGLLWENGIIGGIMGGDTITLYRGVCGLNNGIDDAYSYTTDYEMAKKFAIGRYRADPRANRSDAGAGKIYTVQVASEYIIGRYEERGESEVLVLPPAAGGEIEVLKVEDV